MKICLEFIYIYYSMHEILIAEKIETDRSTYGIELIRTDSGYLYITIDQASYSYLDDVKISKIQVRPENLQKLIDTLINLQTAIRENGVKRRILEPEMKKEIIYRYLSKGMKIATLAVQYDCSVLEIEQMFRDENIAILGDRLPSEKPSRIFWPRKRKKSE